MIAKFAWSTFADEVLRLSPQILADVFQDKRNYTYEQRSEAAVNSVMQVSQLAQSIDPADTDTIAAATSVAATVIAAVRAPSPG